MLRRVGRAKSLLVWAQLLGLFGACHCAKAGMIKFPMVIGTQQHQVVSGIDCLDQCFTWKIPDWPTMADFNHAIISALRTGLRPMPHHHTSMVVNSLAVNLTQLLASNFGVETLPTGRTIYSISPARSRQESQASFAVPRLWSPLGLRAIRKFRRTGTRTKSFALGFGGLAVDSWLDHSLAFFANSGSQKISGQGFPSKSYSCNSAAELLASHHFLFELSGMFRLGSRSKNEVLVRLSESAQPQPLVVSQSAQLGQNASVLFATSYARSDPYRVLPETTRSCGRFTLESYPIANKTLAAIVYIRLAIGCQTSYRALAAGNPAVWRTEVHP
jgi:hypothetical protein